MFKDLLDELLAQKGQYEKESEPLNHNINLCYFKKATEELLCHHVLIQDLQLHFRNLNSQIRANRSENMYAPVGRGKVKLRTGNDQP